MCIWCYYFCSYFEEKKLNIKIITILKFVCDIFNIYLLIYIFDTFYVFNNASYVISKYVYEPLIVNL